MPKLFLLCTFYHCRKKYQKGLGLTILVHPKLDLLMLAAQLATLRCSNSACLLHGFVIRVPKSNRMHITKHDY